MASSVNNWRDMTFSNLPNELMFLLADKLPISDINAICRTSSVANSLIARYMYRRSVVERPRSGTPYFFKAVELGCVAAVRIFIGLDVDVNMRVSGTATEGKCQDEDWDEDPPGLEMDERHKLGHTPLLAAIVCGDNYELMARLLLDAGADIFASCPSFVSALHMAVSMRKSTSFVKSLLVRGADPFTIDWRRQTLLHNAAEGGRPELVQLFLGLGVDVNASDLRRWTPLHFAAMLGRAETTELLLSLGANVHANDQDGNAPLLIAVEYRGSEDMARKLLDRSRANPEALRRAHLDAAKTFDSADKRQIQLFPGLLVNVELPPHPLGSNDRLIELLLAAGGDIVAENRQRYSALLWAAYRAQYVHSWDLT